MTQQRRAPGSRVSGPPVSRGGRGGTARGARSGSAGSPVGRAHGRTDGVGRVRGRSDGRDQARGSARPAARRSGAGQGGAGAAIRTRAPQPRGLTARAAVLMMVLLGLLLAYAYPVRVYLGQQAQINSIEAQQAAQRVKIRELAEQRAKWDDPQYIVAQAKDRLLWTVDGETPYRVIDGRSQRAASSPGSTATRPVRPRPWYGKLWSSIVAADQR